MKKSLTNLISAIFAVAITVFILLGVVIVLTQLLAVCSLNGELAIRISANLKTLAIKFAAIAGVCGFILGYLKPSKEE